MKLVNRFLAIATMSIMVTGVANAAPTVTFQGEVTDQTCQASINGGTNGVVLLPTVSANTLTSSGATAGLTPFTINVTGCTAPSSDLDIKTKFLGHSVTTSGNLSNVATVNPATNVAIQLTKEAAGTTSVVLNGPTAVEGLKLLNGATSASHDFGARYISEAGGATQGAVTSVVEYTLSYQ
ncbi:fimbrial protein [Acinetobacter guillouiae]|uniref:fimbrial protein n=1 Tax=Acinetobacter guillouiae TaxID=106649 RepID=UPI0002CE8F68|nr:fimbrial protein [Acinetobacter guillouiae]ENU58216.1 hypothetical protein F981_02504 [Acinetobacter guillouiae CIP 63.46]KAB0626324.1 type 1 fimbrial protein [Acinetobacter guillouiae]